jgi:hypothetical protein
VSRPPAVSAVFLLALLASGPARAAETVVGEGPGRDWGADAGWQFSLRWGWAGADLAQVAGALWDAGRGKTAVFADAAAAAGMAVTTESRAKNPGGGNSVGLDACWLVPWDKPNTAFGPGMRIHLMWANTRMTVTGRDAGRMQVAEWTSWADSRLVRVMGGLWARGGQSDKGYVRAGFLVGEAFANTLVGENQSSRIPGLGTYYAEYPLSGMGLTAELVCELGLRMSDHFSAFLEFGYHFAEIAKMKWGRDVDADGDGTPDARSGDTFTFPSRENTSFDFTGSQIDLGLRYSL